MTKAANIDFAFEPAQASTLTQKRIEARRKRKRLTYDCMDAVVVSSDTVKCRQGHRFLRNDGGMALLSVLNGRACAICQTCNDYDEEIAE